MPGYDMMFRKDKGSLSWTWAVDRFSKAHNYYLSVTIAGTTYTFELETRNCTPLHLTCSGTFPAIGGCTAGGPFTLDVMG